MRGTLSAKLGPLMSNLVAGCFSPPSPTPPTAQVRSG